MATNLHTFDGVLINPITIRRKYLGPGEEQWARRRREEGELIHEIAHQLGAHPFLVSKAIREARVSDGQMILL
ncbi:hypothetical protein [Pseudogemmobacter humi]|uniref:hypothetical protein n=1 Tax=Pseudogemmobacter humi TaxID=2483812 RepID=UPI000F52D7B2|nr:hypothetical protein [Pseudogemmobacter humi]